MFNWFLIYFSVLGAFCTSTRIYPRRIHALVLAATEHRRRVRRLRSDDVAHHRLCQLLHAAVDGDAPSAAQEPEGGVLLLQRVGRHAVGGADDGRAHLGQAAALRRLQRAQPDGERRVPRAAQVWRRRRQPAILPVQLALPGDAAARCRARPAIIFTHQNT